MEFELNKKQLELKDALNQLGRFVIRPMSLQMDREGKTPDAFLQQFVAMSKSVRNDSDVAAAFGEGQREPATLDKPSQANRTAIVGAEELAWADAGVLLNLPGPGLGGPPVRATGTPEQKQRYFGMLDEADKRGELAWGAYGLTEPGAGSDVGGIRTACRRDGRSWVLNGRKCYITNGAKARWTVIFATVDPALGRAGHRAFVVEKGTPGFSVGKIEDKLGLRASETAELVLEDCRVPEENLLGGDAAYESRSTGFQTAMKTFDATRPLVASMAIGIGRAAYEHARDAAKDRYMLGRPIPRYAALVEKLARMHRRLEAARMLVYKAAYMADTGQPNAKEASMSKAAAAQAATRACIDAIDVVGAEGTIAREDQLLEKWFRDIKVYDIFEGTGQIQRVVISKRILSDLKTF
ncbi:MAG: acyl-CoA dehydrogenase family protein [Polyangiales bacterium]